MGRSKRSARKRARGPVGRQEIRKKTHRVNVPRSSKRSAERSGQPRRK